MVIIVELCVIFDGVDGHFSEPFLLITFNRSMVKIYKYISGLYCTPVVISTRKLVFVIPVARATKLH